jgi:hypothetical protein
LFGLLVEENDVLALIDKLARGNKAGEPRADDYCIRFAGPTSSSDYVRCPE